MDSILEVITQCGLDTVIIAIVTTILTGIMKLPIKKLAQKLTDSHSLTRFITFLPVIIGFGMTVLENYILFGGIQFAQESFYLQWISAASLSLTIYAFWEKFVPSKKKTLTDSDVKENLELLKQVKQAIEGIENTVQESAANISEHETAGQKEIVCTQEPPETAVVELAKKIILKGGSNIQASKEQ